MRSWKFPDMLNTNSSNIWKSTEHLKMTKQNAELLLGSERGELVCDPYFGAMLKHYLFNQNDPVLKDQLIDTIYDQLAIFMPQIYIRRDQIDVFQDEKKGLAHCRFSGIDQITYEPNTYDLVLLTESEN